MSASAVAPQTSMPPVLIGKIPGPKNKPISWEAFKRKYLRREDGFKYEWVDGEVVKTKRSMDKTQLYILENLLRYFDQLQVKGAATGRLISEPDLFFLSQHRRPDIAWLTAKQIYALADPKAYEIPEFVIEVVSSKDQVNALKAKMINYRDAGVKVVWQIFPEYKQVDVYSGPDLEQMTVCSGEKRCSAAPVLPAFEIPANAIFYKPESV